MLALAYYIPKHILEMKIEKLWIDDTYWTRMYLISELNDLKTNKVNIDKVLLVRSHLGDLIGQKYLLTEDANLLFDMVKQSKLMTTDFNKELQAIKEARLVKAKELAKALNKEESIFLMYSSLINEELDMLHRHEWEGSIKTFNKRLDHVKLMI